MTRFLIISTYYKDYLVSLYNKTPPLASLSYEEQLSQIFADGFAWADYWKNNLEKTGKFLAKKIICNAETVQKRWAKENDVNYSQSNWANEILHAQIADFRPEIIFFEDGLGNISGYKTKHPFVKLILSWDGVAQHNPHLYQGVDIILSCKAETAAFYNRHGMKAYLFPFGFEQTILSKLNNRTPRYDTSFVGSLVVHKGGHKQRLELLYHLSKSIPLDLWLSSTGDTDYFSIDQFKRIAKGNLSNAIKLHRLTRYNRGVVYGMEMYQILADSKISLNTHIDVSGEEAANMRLFEATGVGSCLVTDWKKNLTDYFEEDTEVISYKSKGECAEKVSWLLQHEAERKRIAAAGQKRTLENYTLGKRLSDFVRLIEY